jgi:hypothetical protein
VGDGDGGFGEVVDLIRDGDGRAGGDGIARELRVDADISFTTESAARIVHVDVRCRDRGGQCERGEECERLHGSSQRREVVFEETVPVIWPL